MSVATDIIITEVLNQLLLAVAEEMGIALKKTAFSPNIKERADSSTAIFDAQGQVVVQAAHIPIHLSSMIGLVEGMVRLRDESALEPGDMFLGNDPFVCGGSHLNDIAVALPVFAGPDLIGFVASIAHHSDVGGRVAGSEVGDNTEIFQDGLRLPLMKVMSRGRVDRHVMDLILTNSRTPWERQGDFNAQFAANLLGARKVEELHRKFGPETYRATVEALLDYTEQRTRAEIRKLPEGTYQARGCLDDDGIGSKPLPVIVRVEVQNGSVAFDFAGTHAQVGTSVNSTKISLLAGIYYVMRAILDPTLPTNAGFYRPFRVEAPVGSLLNAQPPASVAVRFRSVQCAVDLVCAAMAEAVPERTMAGSRAWWGVIVSGIDPTTGQAFVDYEAHIGGGGAKASKDGWDATWSHCSNSSNLPIEVLEAEYPLQVVRYALRPDSGGPGRFRGGLGCIREMRPTREAVRFSVRGDAYRIPPHGLLGGKPGVRGSVYRVARQRRERLPATFVNATLRPGERLRILSAGGGGFGPALERDPLRVLEDVEAGKISTRHAAREYGVVIRSGTVDRKGTDALRSRLRRRDRRALKTGGR